MIYYQNVWNDFIHSQHTLAADKRNYPEWHKGRMRYFVWIVAIDNPLVMQRWQDAKSSLDKFLLKPYAREAHITLSIAGFLCTNKRWNDDITIDDIERQIADLQSLGIRHFRLDISGINSFLSAPFLEVIDREGGIQTLRNALQKISPDIRTDDYTPHITLGIFSRQFVIRDVVSELAINPLENTISMNVSRILLVSYDASDIGSSLHIEHEIILQPV